MRGIASIIVVFHHICIAFLPNIKENFPRGLGKTPLYFLINGSAAVNFFFALSGFVLTYRFFQSPSLNYLIVSSLKRLPRLMLPASITIAVGYLILDFGSTNYLDAAEITGSKWLATFGNANFPNGFTATSADALSQVWRVFLIPRNNYYNSNLWTMRPEFLGSLIVFATATVAFLEHRWAGFVMLTLLGCATRFAYPIAFPFLAGSLLAFVLANWPTLIIGVKPRPLVLLGILVIGMSRTKADYQVLASVLLIAGLIAMPTVSRVLSGSASIVLGKISFPLYLVHTLVILSVSSYAYVEAGVFAAVVTTFVVSGIALVPIVMLEEWWVPFLKRVARARLGGDEKAPNI